MENQQSPPHRLGSRYRFCQCGCLCQGLMMFAAVALGPVVSLKSSSPRAAYSPLGHQTLPCAAAVSPSLLLPSLAPKISTHVSGVFTSLLECSRLVFGQPALFPCSPHRGSSPFCIVGRALSQSQHDSLIESQLCQIVTIWS